jgi:hypothetical protein
LNASRDENCALIAATSDGAEEGSDAGEEGGHRDGQKREWLMCPPPWNFLGFFNYLAKKIGGAYIAACRAILTSPLLRAVMSAEVAALRLVT